MIRPNENGANITEDTVFGPLSVRDDYRITVEVVAGSGTWIVESEEGIDLTAKAISSADVDNTGTDGFVCFPGDFLEVKMGGFTELKVKIKPVNT